MFGAYFVGAYFVGAYFVGAYFCSRLSLFEFTLLGVFFVGAYFCSRLSLFEAFFVEPNGETSSPHGDISACETRRPGRLQAEKGRFFLTGSILCDRFLATGVA